MTLCGSTLQSIDKTKEGYIREEKISDAKYCERCFKIMHYGKSYLLDKKVMKDELIKEVNKSNKAVLYLVDVTSISEETLSPLKELTNKVYVILTKKDLLPRSVKDYKLINYIKENNVKTILEIGSAIGYSAIKFANIDNDITVTTIERDDERYNLAVENINNSNLSNRIKIIHSDAFLVELEDKFDMIFIDAAKSQYIKFFEKFKKNLNDKGVIISDNLSFHGFVEHPELTNNRNTRQLVGKIRKYINFLKENNEFETVFYDLGDGVSVSTKI